MTLLAFAKAMLGDQLAKYGFEHRRNTTWVKVSDEGIYFAVSFKKHKFYDDYCVRIFFNIQPVFSKLYNYEYRLGDWYDYMYEAGLIPSEFANRVHAHEPLMMVEETDTRYESMLETGRILFSAVLEPLLVSVHDMDSCYAANFELNYIAYKRIRDIKAKTDTRAEMKNYDRSSYNMIYTQNTFPMVLCLCKAKRYSDALKLLQNCGKMSSICFEEGSITLGKFCEEVWKTEGYKLWYIERLEKGNYSEIEGNMKVWYEHNSEELKKKYGLSVEYEFEAVER